MRARGRPAAISIAHGGRTYTVEQFARAQDVSPKTIYLRLRQGLRGEELVTGVRTPETTGFAEVRLCIRCNEKYIARHPSATYCGLLCFVEHRCHKPLPGWKQKG